LKELLINRNKIRSLNYLALANFSPLVRLNASHNQLAEEELENIARVTLSLHNLKNLDLFGNPVANSHAYKFRLTENSSIEKLDGLDVKGVIKERLDTLRRDWQIN
jgi:Leucine-rich repeat (LRR) protein